MAYFSVLPWGISSEKLVIISCILVFLLSNSPKVFVSSNFLGDLLFSVEKYRLFAAFW